MKGKFYLPTRVIAGKSCVVANADLLAKLGARALVVCGRSSAKSSGALADVETALASKGIGYSIFDRISPNPGIEACREAAQAAKDFKADFIVAIGGGSPLDAAKAAAVLARNQLADADIFGGSYPGGALPVAAIPTTAGTGSEVTQYAILTNDSLESKSSLAWDGIFPALAFLDPAYTKALPRHTTVNTALDALSHAVEGYLSQRADYMSQALAREAMALLGLALKSLVAKPAADVSEEIRAQLLSAANLAGAVIAQTATTIVHAMGYSLTYFKDIDHGRANGLLLAAYLEAVMATKPTEVAQVLAAMGLESLSGFRALMDSLLGQRESISQAELEKFSAMAMKTKHVLNTSLSLSEAAVAELYAKSLARA